MHRLSRGLHRVHGEDRISERPRKTANRNLAGFVSVIWALGMGTDSPQRLDDTTYILLREIMSDIDTENQGSDSITWIQGRLKFE